ncbi:MAG: nucleotidyl transferase AbiEii/AbiGii toxin family protein, partial [Candidatus Latescibacteria bacterium]|nr:nucleotidyl transferase AbiEii/AbiGii toxin family protein [Candidatus Latescibacterota bacterium]
LEGASAEVFRASGVVARFSREDRKTHQNSHTFYLAYGGPLPGTSVKGVKVDITIRERFVCPVPERPIIRGYDEYADLPEDAFVRVYSLDEIAVEKLVALTDRARNEPRDLYDL